MPTPSQVSALSLALFVHGLSIYFVVAGALGLHTKILTAIFQIGTVAIAFFYILRTKEAKSRLIKLGGIEALYLAFTAIFIYDLLSFRHPEKLPENFMIYTSLYWLALFLLRSLSFQQLKIFCYATAYFSATACLILMIQVFTGTANWVDNGGRLALGTSGNPILSGYVGGYCFLTSLILWIKEINTPRKLFWLICGCVGLYICAVSGTRSATLSTILAGGLIGTYALIITIQSQTGFSRFLCSICLITGIIICLLVVTPVISSQASLNSQTEFSPIVSALNNGTRRIDSLLQVTSGGEADLSTQGREKLYTSAWDQFQRNPVSGNGFYSIGGAHNVFLQVAAEYGLMGILTFIMPFFLIIFRFFIIIGTTIKEIASSSYRVTYRFLKSDYWMVTGFCLAMLIQTSTVFSFHGDPYRNSLSLSYLGLLIAFLRLPHSQLRKTI